jgi:hypothetical protein
LGGLVLVPPVIHDPAHRWIGLVGHLDEVEAELAGSGQRLWQWSDAELVAVGTDEPNLSGTDAVVDPGFVAGGCYRRSLLVNALLFSLALGLGGDDTVAKNERCGRRESRRPHTRPCGQLLESTRAHMKRSGRVGAGPRFPSVVTP